jgi:nitrile hydratase
MLERRLISENELEAGRSLGPPSPDIEPLAVDHVAERMARGAPTSCQRDGTPRFAVGDRVRTREWNPPTHTRIPRYCRGKTGVIARFHGAHAYPDSRARGLGDDPQWLYTLRFDAAELWGSDTTASSICVDLWEPYLEAVAGE